MSFSPSQNLPEQINMLLTYDTAGQDLKGISFFLNYQGDASDVHLRILFQYKKQEAQLVQECTLSESSHPIFLFEYAIQDWKLPATLSLDFYVRGYSTPLYFVYKMTKKWAEEHISADYSQPTVVTICQHVDELMETRSSPLLGCDKQILHKRNTPSVSKAYLTAPARPTRRVRTIDLHLEELTNEPTHDWTSAEKLQYQLKALQKELNIACMKRYSSLEVVHGFGKGVLRDAVHHLLREQRFTVLSSRTNEGITIVPL